MDQFVRDIGSLYWWLSVFVVGVLINLVASALWFYGPKLLARVSESWAQRTSQKAAEYQEIMRRLVEDPEARLADKLSSIWTLLTGIVYFVFATGSGTLSYMVTLALVEPQPDRVVYALKTALWMTAITCLVGLLLGLHAFIRSIIWWTRTRVAERRAKERAEMVSADE